MNMPKEDLDTLGLDVQVVCVLSMPFRSLDEVPGDIIEKYQSLVSRRLGTVFVLALTRESVLFVSSRIVLFVLLTPFIGLPICPQRGKLYHIAGSPSSFEYSASVDPTRFFVITCSG